MFETGLPLEPGPVEERFPFWTYEDVALLLAAILPSGLIAFGLARMACSNRGLQTLISQTVFFGLLLLVLYGLVSVRYSRPFWRSMGWFWPVPGAHWCFLAGPFLAFAVGALGVVLHAPELQDPIKGLITNRISLAIVMLFAVVLGPVYEELFFRGFLFPLLAKSFGALLGVLLSAFLFGLLHGAQYQWAWQQVMLVTLAGVAFGFVRHRTGSTAASTILHGCFNLTQFVLFLALRSGI